MREALADNTRQRCNRVVGVIVAEGGAVAVAELELSEVAVQMLLAAMLVDALHAALEDQEIAFNQAIDSARDRLTMPCFDLHQQFLAARGPVRPEVVGEPKQAQAWLDRLATAAGNGR